MVKRRNNNKEIILHRANQSSAVKTQNIGLEFARKVQR